MGNRPGKVSTNNRAKNQMNNQDPKSADENGTPHHKDDLPSNTVGDENIYVTERSENGANGSLLESEIASSVSSFPGSTSDLSVREVQQIIRENRIKIINSNNPHIGDSINCYGPVSFVSSSQSNVQIINQQCAPIVHDFGELTTYTSKYPDNLRSQHSVVFEKFN